MQSPISYRVLARAHVGPWVDPLWTELLVIGIYSLDVPRHGNCYHSMPESIYRPQTLGPTHFLNHLFQIANVVCKATKKQAIHTLGNLGKGARPSTASVHDSRHAFSSSRQFS